MLIRDWRKRAAMEAAEWLASIGDKSPDRRTSLALLHWLLLSPIHIAEFLRMMKLRSQLSAFSDWDRLPGIAPQITSDDTNNVVRLSENLRAQITIASETRGRARWAPAVTAVVFGTVVLMTALVAVRGIRSTEYRTVTAQRLDVHFSDGTLIHLGPDTSLTVRTTWGEHYVRLVEGDAVFDVNAPAHGHLLVAAGDIRIRDIGTVFGVRRNQSSVQITVEQGQVVAGIRSSSGLLHKGVAPSRKTLTLDANRQVTFTSAGAVGPIREVDAERALAWTNGRLEFLSTPVAQAVRQFNRFNRTRIYIADSNLNARLISGAFSVTDPESFVAFLKVTAGVRVLKVPPDTIVLEMKGPR